MALNTEKMDCHKCGASQADGPLCCKARALDVPTLKTSLEKKLVFIPISSQTPGLSPARLPGPS